MKRTRLDIYKPFSYSQIEKVIDEWVLSRRDRAVLKLKLLDGVTYEGILKEDFPDKETCTSVDKIKDIIKDAEETLYKHLIINYKP